MSAEPHTPAVRGQVLAALAAGATISSAAKSFSLSRQTIYNWLDSESFALEVRNASAEYAQTVRDELQQQTADAIHTLGEVMRDPTAPAHLRVRVALAVLNRPRDPKQAWQTPVPLRQDAIRNSIDALDRMDEQDAIGAARASLEHLIATVAAGAGPQPAQPEIHGIEPEKQPALDKIGHKNDVQCPTVPPEPPAKLVPRSASCPCGSGEKYKRCCGRNAPPVLSKPASSPEAANTAVSAPRP